MTKDSSTTEGLVCQWWHSHEIFRLKIYYKKIYNNNKTTYMQGVYLINLNLLGHNCNMLFWKYVEEASARQITDKWNTRVRREEQLILCRREGRGAKYTEFWLNSLRYNCMHHHHITSPLERKQIPYTKLPFVLIEKPLSFTKRRAYRCSMASFQKKNGFLQEVRSIPYKEDIPPPNLTWTFVHFSPTMEEEHPPWCTSSIPMEGKWEAGRNSLFKVPCAPSDLPLLTSW